MRLVRWLKALFCPPPPKTVFRQRIDVKCPMCYRVFPMMFPAKGGKAFAQCSYCLQYVTAKANAAKPGTELEEYTPFVAWF